MIDPNPVTMFLCWEQARQFYVQTYIPLYVVTLKPLPFSLTLQMLSKEVGNFEGGWVEYREPSQIFYCQ